MAFPSVFTNHFSYIDSDIDQLIIKSAIALSLYPNFCAISMITISINLMLRISVH